MSYRRTQSSVNSQLQSSTVWIRHISTIPLNTVIDLRLNMYSWLMDSDDDDDVGRGVRRVRSPTHIYHYTNSNGYIGITSSMRIKSFARDSTHARLGFGVYFTDLAPESSTNAILMDCYHHTAFQSKASYYVKIKKSDVEYVKHPSRDVYCVLGKDGMDLNTVPHEFGSR